MRNIFSAKFANFSSKPITKDSFSEIIQTQIQTKVSDELNDLFNNVTETIS